MIPAELKKWFAFGSGIGIEIAGPHGAESLRITAIRVRPTGARVLDRLTIEDFPHQSAGVWGTDYAAFLRKLDLHYSAAMVLLPRNDVIVRQLTLPGVSDKDLPSALQFQMDSLHPYPEDDVVSSWARLPGSSTILVGIARRAVIERYSTIFAEAGVKVAGFTCSAAAIYSALRLHGAPKTPELLAREDAGGQVELYGESPARPLFSASFDARESRAAAQACAELRIDPVIEPQPLEQVLSATPALPYAAAVLSACPRLSIPLNLLPVDQRQVSSRTAWIPTAVLGVIVLLLGIALVAFPGVENRRYERSLQAEIKKVEPLAARATQIDRQIENARQRTLMLDNFRSQSKSDMDVLAEFTRILSPPTWVTSLEISRNYVTVAGETPQAAPLLKMIDTSPLFQASEFSMPPIHSPNGEMFRIHTNREAHRP